MKEKDVQRLFGKQNKVHGVFELKLCKGKSLSFDSVADHQIKALTKAEGSEGLYHKISDTASRAAGVAGFSRFTAPKPFDCFFLKDTPAYVVIVFYVPSKKKTAYYIPVHEFVNMRQAVESGSLGEKPRKSFTEPHAEVYAEHFLELKNDK